ncbi:MAG: DUF4411 family protein [Deltaproteobacteria bacterium]|nr:DUF4411 family protein [Deltaproteobacteria bacterium]
MAFCLDTNVFVEAHRSRYPIDMAPGFWDALVKAAEKDLLHSIEAVYDELAASKDELAAWAKEHHDVLFRKNDDAKTQAALVELGQFLNERKPAYRDEAKEAFLAGADPWLVAYCKAYGHVLVTEEVEAPQGVRQVKIPDVAVALDVETATMLKMLRALGVRLVAG